MRGMVCMGHSVGQWWERHAWALKRNKKGCWHATEKESKIKKETD